MPNGFPCPNPTCTHVFPPDVVKGAAALACPRCGTVYQFGGPARPAVPKPASSPAQQVARPPVKKPVPPPLAPASPKVPPPLPKSAAGVRTVAPAPPEAPLAPLAPVAPLAPIAPLAAEPVAGLGGLHFEADPRERLSSRSRKEKGKRRGRRMPGWLAPLLVLIVVAGAVTGGVLAVRAYYPWEEEDGEQKATNKSLGNFAFKPPGGWKPDVNLRQQMHVNLAMTRRTPRTHMGLFYRDYKTRLPGDAEMLDVALRKLRGYFPQMDYEDPFAKENKGRSTELGGESAVVLDFAASDASEVPMRGQCVMVARQGYGYWLFTWAPEDELLDEARQYWQTLRSGFLLLNEREGWKPQPRPSQEFQLSGAPFALNFVKDVWEKQENPAEWDDRAELVLRGFEPVEDEEKGTKKVVRYAGRAATVQVLVLEKSATPKAGAESALEHIRKKIGETNPSVRIEPMKDRKTDKPLVSTEVGKMRGLASKLVVQLDPETQRYGLLAVVNHPTATLVVYCECKLDRSVYWDGEFKALLDTIRVKGK